VLRRGARGKAWEVLLDGQSMARFSSVEEAVQAVDYEVERLGPLAAASALEDAPWRRRPPPPELLPALPERRPPSLAHGPLTLGAALRLAALAFARSSAR
jgi:ATP-dependent helicase IRC3